jgi:muconate cycloisomerase
MWESGIGIAASLHFACSSPAVKYGSDFYTCTHLTKDDLIVEALDTENGDILLPTGPGLGVEVDWEAVERYRVE